MKGKQAGPKSPVKKNTSPERRRQPEKQLIPHVEGIKPALNVRGLARALPGAIPAPLPPQKTQAVAAGGPLYADSSLCAQHAAKAFFRPSVEELKELVMYGELTQLTYDSFRNKQSAAKVLGTPRRGDQGFEQRYKEDSMSHITDLLQPGSLARSRGYKVIDFLYANSGWQFGEVARAVNKGVGRLMELAGSDSSPDGIPLASWLQQQYNWIGFVAVSDPGPGKLIDDLVIAFRGTITSSEWLADFDAFLIEAFPWAKNYDVDGSSDDDRDDLPSLHPRSDGLPHLKQARVCRGFKRMYARPFKRDPGNRPAPQEQIYEDMEWVFGRREYNIGSVTCIGHSLGGALSTLAAYDVAQLACVPYGVKVRVCSFGAPKVGDDRFVANFQKLGIQVQRVINVRDVVPTVPGLTTLALKQVGEALGTSQEKTKQAKKSVLEDFGAALKLVLRDAARGMAMEIADFVEEMAAWKYNPAMGPLLGSFHHACDPIALDTRHTSLSKLIRQPPDLSGCHNLEMALYMLDPARDRCLINKGADILSGSKAECRNWWAISQDVVPPKCPGGCP